jgi:hypothetical protein
MVCQACGSPAQGAFCSQCGVPAPIPTAHPAPPPNAYQPPPPAYSVPVFTPYPGHVDRHLRTLGSLWLVYGTFRAIGGIIATLVLAGVSTGAFVHSWIEPRAFPFSGGAPLMAGIAIFVAVMTLLYSALSFLVGYALLNRKPWGRTLAIVIGILQLIKFPFGTIVGIYTLWVLAPRLSGAEYEALADHS